MSIEREEMGLTIIAITENGEEGSFRGGEGKRLLMCLLGVGSCHCLCMQDQVLDGESTKFTHVHCSHRLP